MENKVGRPPKYETPEELQAKINEYFESGVNTRTVIVGPPNNRSEAIIKVPTITGLVLYCGFCDRSSFYDLEKNEAFTYTIKKARCRMEQEYEEQLQSGMPTGAIFALKNFDWKDTPSVDASTHYHFTTIQKAIEYANNGDRKTEDTVSAEDLAR